MRPGCLFGMISSVGGMPVRGVCMVGGLLVVPGVVVFASLCVVSSSLCGVFCRLLVMFRSFLGHGVFPLLVWLPVGRPYSLGKQRNSRIGEAFLMMITSDVAGRVTENWCRGDRQCWGRCAGRYFRRAKSRLSLSFLLWRRGAQRADRMKAQKTVRRDWILSAALIRSALGCRHRVGFPSALTALVNKP
jgi:hypothetical protein